MVFYYATVFENGGEFLLSVDFSLRGRGSIVDVADLQGIEPVYTLSSSNLKQLSALNYFVNVANYVGRFDSNRLDKIVRNNGGQRK